MSPFVRPARAARRAGIGSVALLLAAGAVAPVATAETTPVPANTVAAAVSAPANVATAGPSAATTVTWRAVGAFPSGVTSAGFDVQKRTVTIKKRKRVYGAPSALATSTAATSARFRAPKGSTHQYRARTIDSRGAIGPWSPWSVLSTTPLDDRSPDVIYGVGWKSGRSDSRWAGTFRRTKGSDRLVLTSAAGTSGFAVLTTKGKRYGWVNVFVDGQFKKRVSLYAASTKHRKQVYSVTFAKPGQHDITLITRSKGKRNRVDLDAIVVRH